MIMRIVYPDGSWFIGDRGRKEMGYLFNHETKDTHHYLVLDGTKEFKQIIGKEVAVPINSAKYFQLNFNVNTDITQQMANEIKV